LFPSLNFSHKPVSPEQDHSGNRVKRIMSKVSQQDVSVLSAAKRGLVHLTPNDWMLIADKAARMTFKAGELIVCKGKRTHGVYLILKGTASVQLPKQALSPPVGTGEVCGEISFIDELPATANVIAREEVEAYYLDRPTLLSLFELFPHLGSRFYRSLASSLSRRLRELIGPAEPVK
jgi:CRP-like cAMP-binding protein